MNDCKHSCKMCWPLLGKWKVLLSACAYVLLLVEVWAIAHIANNPWTYPIYGIHATILEIVFVILALTLVLYRMQISGLLVSYYRPQRRFSAKLLVFPLYFATPLADLHFLLFGKNQPVISFWIDGPTLSTTLIADEVSEGGYTASTVDEFVLYISTELGHLITGYIHPHEVELCATFENAGLYLKEDSRWRLDCSKGNHSDAVICKITVCPWSLEYDVAREITKAADEYVLLTGRKVHNELHK